MYRWIWVIVYHSSPAICAAPQKHKHTDTNSATVCLRKNISTRLLTIVIFICKPRLAQSCFCALASFGLKHSLDVNFALINNEKGFHSSNRVIIIVWTIIWMFVIVLIELNRDKMKWRHFLVHPRRVTMKRWKSPRAELTSLWLCGLCCAGFIECDR